MKNQTIGDNIYTIYTNEFDFLYIKRWAPNDVSPKWRVKKKKHIVFNNFDQVSSYKTVEVHTSVKAFIVNALINGRSKVYRKNISRELN